MAQLDGMRRYTESPKTSPRTPTTPTFEQLLNGDASRWPAPTTPTLGKDHDQEEDHSHHNKKSVLTKVKEKAKKWKHTLVKKKHGHDDNATPAWGVSLDEDDDDDEEEDPEYFGAPMYESELAPEGYKETARQHPREIPMISEKQILVSSITHQEEQYKGKNPSKTITETVTEKLAPAYATVSEATQMITSKFQGLAVSVGSSAASETGEQTCCGENKWDKGVSVKEYFMQKLEPGEEERALSQVITEAISPKKLPGDMGLVEKVREAVTSFLRTDESSSATTKMSTNIPTSTYVHEVVEEENEGRILQAN